MRAESLIYEAIVIYKRKKDELGLAGAYRSYAYFLQSQAVTEWEKTYRRSGFMDQAVSFDTRYQGALEYWKLALHFFEKNSAYGDAANVYYNIGRLAYVAFNDTDTACKNYTKSTKSHLLFLEDYPDIEFVMPAGYDSFTGFIEAMKEEAGCEV